MRIQSSSQHGLRALSPEARRLVAMRFLVYVGIQASYFIGVLGTLTYALGSDALDTALAVAFMNACLIVGSFAGGSLLDAWGPRRHFVVAVGGLVTASLYFLTTDGTAARIILGAALLGFMIGLTDVIARSYPAHLTGDARELKRINGAISAASNIGVVVGPLVGGAIASVASSKSVFVFTLVASLAALVPWAGFRATRGVHADIGAAAHKTEGGVRQEDAQQRSSLKAGVRAVAASAPLTLLFWVGFLCFLGYGAFDPLESLFYRDVLRVGVSWMGWLSAAAGVGAILGALVAMRLPGRFVSFATLLVVQLCEGMGCLIYVGTSSAAVALLGQVILGCAFGAFTPLQNTLMQKHAPLVVVGRVSSIMNFGFNVAGVLPLLAAPWLAEQLGVQGALIAASLVVTVMPILIMASARERVRRIDHA
ncbi:MFS transporter [Enorma phocaeensis]|uniref:MFS transporter n=1 Tax=Enorma phocaeensis TaxID=1871019 RepID=UPI00195DFB54|nr:MFS transporter [Enorma phocaeensis]MBM6953534.1 MFS transporter [Enorma phocaeensis]